MMLYSSLLRYSNAVVVWDHSIRSCVILLLQLLIVVLELVGALESMSLVW